MLLEAKRMLREKSVERVIINSSIQDLASLGRKTLQELRSLKIAKIFWSGTAMLVLH